MLSQQDASIFCDLSLFLKFSIVLLQKLTLVGGLISEVDLTSMVAPGRTLWWLLPGMVEEAYSPEILQLHNVFLTPFTFSLRKESLSSSRGRCAAL